MHRNAFALTLGMLLVAVGCPAAELTVGTWNIRMLSANSRDSTERTQILNQLVRFDLVAVQEVRDDSIIAILTDSLRARGGAWDSAQSPAVGVSPNDERYAFLWRPDRVAMVGEVQTWDDTDDLFIREPSWARFQAGAFDFVLVTVHTLYGDRVDERRGEAMLLDEVMLEVQAANPDEGDVWLLGDLNLPPTDVGFDGLEALGLSPLFPATTRTTIADTDCLDNLWLNLEDTSEWTGDAGVVRFDEEVFGGEDDIASLRVSDHRPCWATFLTDGPDDDGNIVTSAQLSTWGMLKAHR